MRCLTLGAELRSRGHDVELHAELGDVTWLADAAVAAGVPVAAVEAGSLDPEPDADAVVVDSYDIPADAISRLSRRVPVLAIVDGDTRGIEATRYLDHNLGAEALEWPPATDGRLLAGSRYALVRQAVLDARSAEPWALGPGRPVVTVVLGGTDAAGVAPALAGELAGLDAEVRVVAVDRDDLIARTGVVVLTPTPELPRLLAESDVVVTAAGSSAWEVCTLGVPALFLAIAPNQQPSLSRLVDAGLGLGLDVAADPHATALASGLVTELLGDVALRRTLAERCRALFDGRGTSRVADELEGAQL